MKTRLKTRSALLVLAFLTTIITQQTSATNIQPAHGEFTFTGDSIVLPLNLDSGHPRITVEVGDGQQHTFIVDTGASVSVMDSAIADLMGYEVIGEMEIGAPGGPQIMAGIVRVPEVRLGDATINNAEFVTMDVNGFSNGITQGVIGFGVFRDYLLTFDYGQGLIVVSRDSLTADRPGVLAYNDMDGHINLDGEVAGTQLTFHIDTGSMGEFTLPIEIMDSLPLQASAQPTAKARVVGGDRDISFAQLDGDIQFGGFTYENPAVAFLDPSPNGRGNVGSGIFGRYIISIDQRNHLILFREQAGDLASATSRKPRRLGVMFRGMGGGPLTVSGVVPGSLAESTGFRAGDILVSVNGLPAADYSMPELGKLLGSAKPLSFRIERDGASKILEIN